MGEAAVNRRIVLARRPQGAPTEEDFRPGRLALPAPAPGQVLLRTIYLSLDPYMRGRMNAGPSYAPRIEIGQVMGGRAVCEVVESNLPNYHPEEIVLAYTGWQTYSLSGGEGT